MEDFPYKPTDFEDFSKCDGEPTEAHTQMLVWVCYNFLGNVVGQNTFNNSIVAGNKQLWKYATESDVAFALFVIDTYFDIFKQCAQDIKNGGTGKIPKSERVKTKHELAIADDDKNGRKAFVELVGKVITAVNSSPTFEEDFQKYYSDRHQQQDRNSSKKQKVDDLALEKSKSYNQGVRLGFYSEAVRDSIEAALKNPLTKI